MKEELEKLQDELRLNIFLIDRYEKMDKLKKAEEVHLIQLIAETGRMYVDEIRLKKKLHIDSF